MSDLYLGTLDRVIYFVNHRDPAHPEGYVMLAPYSHYSTPEGYSREECCTLADVDRLQRRLTEQEQREMERDRIYDEVLVGQRRQQIRDRLYARMVSSSTSAFERDFIEAYLKLREEKRDRHRQRWTERTMYLWAREMDSHKSRRVHEEKVNAERIG